MVFVQLAGVSPPLLTPSDLTTTLGAIDTGGFLPPGAPPGVRGVFAIEMPPLRIVHR